ncbi:MAG TPA: hypothetical protein VLK29_13050 [Luteimonas sp.]|nr:hypothetical protein [Luteimonas sp.]
MSDLKKDHVLASGAGALAAGAIGGAIGGVLAGPPGIVAGVAAGAALGAVGAHKASEAVDPRGDLGHFEQIYQTMPYYVTGMTWSDYAPAYAYGLRTHDGAGGDSAHGVVGEEGWQQAKGASRLLWSEAQPAVAHVWRDLDATATASGGASAPAP